MDKKLEEKIKRAKKEGVDIKLTGSEFRQYVHISTRKMKYLMDNNIVPHLNTGQTTHKYDIKKSDADEFLRKVKCDPSFMAESKGLFDKQEFIYLFFTKELISFCNDLYTFATRKPSAIA